MRDARAITFQLADVSISGDLFNHILAVIQRLRAPLVSECGSDAMIRLSQEKLVDNNKKVNNFFSDAFVVLGN